MIVIGNILVIYNCCFVLPVSISYDTGASYFAGRDVSLPLNTLALFGLAAKRRYAIYYNKSVHDVEFLKYN